MYVVLPLAIVLVATAVVAFVWAARHGQFDDLDTPARRILFDDDPSPPSPPPPAIGPTENPPEASHPLVRQPD